jgi:hypothetical protein
VVRVIEVQPLDAFRVRVEFTDHSARVIDLTPYLRGPIFEPIRNDRRLFERVRVDRELGTIVWPNGADIDPDVLAGLAPPAWATETDVPHLPG